MVHTGVKKAQVSWRASEAVSRRRVGACGTHMVARQTESQLLPISVLLCVECTGWTLSDTGAICKMIYRHSLIPRLLALMYTENTDIFLPLNI